MRRSGEGSSRRIRIPSLVDSLIDLDEDDDSSYDAPQLVRRSTRRSGKEPTQEPENVEDSEDTEDDSSSNDSADDWTNEDLPVNVNHKQALKDLKQIPMEGTRYPHRRTMMQLGIAADVDQLLRNVELTHFVSTPRETYVSETVQFLASVELREYLPNEERLKEIDGFGTLIFSVNGKKYSFSAAAFEQLFALPHSDGLDAEFIDSEHQLIWQLIGPDEVYDPSKSKSARIRNPGIRYFHKILGTSCFARHESGNVRRPEMVILEEALLGHLNALDDGKVYHGNLNKNGCTKALMQQLPFYKGWAKTLKSKKNATLCIGGLVTRILEAAGVQIKSKDSLPPEYLDISYLIQHKFLKKSTARSHWLYRYTLHEGGLSVCKLPNTDCTTLSVPSNLDFTPPASAIILPAGRGRQVPSQRATTAATERYSFPPSVDPELKQAVLDAHTRIDELDQTVRKTVGETTAMQKVIEKFSFFGFGKRKSKKRSSRTQLAEEEPAYEPSRASTYEQRPPSQMQPHRASSYEPRQELDLNLAQEPEPQFERSRRSSSRPHRSRTPTFQPTPPPTIPSHQPTVQTGVSWLDNRDSTSHQLTPQAGYTSQDYIGSSSQPFTPQTGYGLFGVSTQQFTQPQSSSAFDQPGSSSQPYNQPAGHNFVESLFDTTGSTEFFTPVQNPDDTDRDWGNFLRQG